MKTEQRIGEIWFSSMSGILISNIDLLFLLQ